MRIVVDGLPYAVVVTTSAAQEAALILGREPLRVFFVIDQAVERRASLIIDHLAAEGCSLAGKLVVRSGEKYKRWPSVEALHQRFTESALDRDSIVVAVGGGTLTDVSGFAAAVYLRGIRWLPVATTLTGMVDAAIGGKTGINTPAGKNLTGAFWPPIGSISDVGSLDSLPRAAFREGVAEIVKAAIIGDAALLKKVLIVEKSASSAGWPDIIAGAAAVKVREVAKDPNDRGSRASLNLGHTFAHAFERASNYKLKHGGAVALGLRAAGILARDVTGWSLREHRDVLKALSRFGLRLRLPRLAPAEILEAMQVDKKRKGGTNRFVLPVHLGEVQTGVEIADAVVVRALEQLSLAPSSSVW